MVRSPCTLLWPRTGTTPAPGLPIWPRSSCRFTRVWMVAMASSWWVRPMHQVTRVAFELASSSANWWIASAVMPDSAVMRCQLSARSSAIRASKPSVCCWMKPRSKMLRPCASSSTQRFITPLSAARSPPILTV